MNLINVKLSILNKKNNIFEEITNWIKIYQRRIPKL
jgi:hypothetical protein